MKIYFCPECGAYDYNHGSVCVDCNEPIPPDSWADVSEEEIAELTMRKSLSCRQGFPHGSMK